MKKFISIFGTIIILAIVGCSSIQFQPQAENLAITIAAKHLAYEFGYKYPEMIKDGIEICDEILKANAAEDTTLYLFQIATQTLGKQIKNPVMRSDYEDLLRMVQLNGEGKIDLKQAIYAVQGFKAGLELRNK